MTRITDDRREVFDPPYRESRLREPFRRFIALGVPLWIVIVLTACGTVGRFGSTRPAALTLAQAVPTQASSLPPCDDDPFQVDLREAIGTLPEDTLDAQREQIRDWIFSAVLGRLSRQTSIEDVFTGISDVPVVRDDSLAHALRLPTGPTRAVTTKAGNVVVLVDANAGPTIDAEVLEAIDDESVALGHAPARADVYRYDLAPAATQASVCHVAQWDRARVDGAAAGYRRESLRTAADVQRFVADGVDLLSARCTDSGVDVTGRQRARVAAADVTAEQLAAIARPLGVRYLPPEHFGATLASMPASARADIERRARALDEVSRLPDGALRQASGTVDPRMRALDTLLDWKARNPQVRSADIVLSYELQQVFEGKIGFSLDPQVSGTSTPLPGPAGPSAAPLCARYDGPLAGTVAGMTLFYTDLSAKFSVFDWGGKSPEGVIDGFESVIHHVGSAAWCAEPVRRSIRVWFGARDEGYVPAGDGSLRFAPTSTRLFAKGSDSASGESEVEPPAESRRFIGWWNQHYARIAAWEPQYEALNQLVKWSLVVQSARTSRHANCLSALRSTPVGHDARLDTWSAAKPALRWRDAIASAHITATGRECLPPITSDPYKSCGDVWTLEGGVDLASRAQYQRKVSFRAPISAGVGRMGPGIERVQQTKGRLQFDLRSRAMAGGHSTAVELASERGMLRFRARIDGRDPQVGSTKLADPSAPVRQVEKTVSTQGNGVKIAQRYNQIPCAELLMTDIDRANVRVGVKIQEAQIADAIARRVSQRPDWMSFHDAAAALAREHDIFLLQNDYVAVGFDTPGGQREFAIMASGAGNRGPPRKDWGLVVGSDDGGPFHLGDVAGHKGKSVEFWRVPPADAQKYIRDQQGRRIAPPVDTTLGAVLSRLRNNDFAVAIAEYKKQPTVASATKLLEDAAGRNDTAAADQVIAELGRTGALENVFPLRGHLDAWRARQRQAGAATAALDRLVMIVEIFHGRRVHFGLAEANAVSQHVGPVIAPPSYPAQIGLPPPIHPRGKPLPPDAAYVARVVDLPADVQIPSGRTTAGGETYEYRPGPVPGSRARDGYRSAVNWFRPTRGVIVLRCDDADASRPPCHERVPLPSSSSPMHACDLNHDGDWEDALEMQCVFALIDCDANDDDQLSGPAETACVEAVRKKYQPVSPPASRQVP